MFLCHCKRNGARLLSPENEEVSEILKIELRHIANITDFAGEFPQHVVVLCFYLLY